MEGQWHTNGLTPCRATGEGGHSKWNHHARPRLGAHVMRQSEKTAGVALSTLERYAEAFRELVNARVWRSDESPSKALRLNFDSDWEFICVAMDVVGDAALALGDFLRFSLDGPTRYESTGERYLRLYGLLSAAYLQQEAVLKLYSLMNCAKPKDVELEFANLDIRILRHQVASHSVDYRAPGTRDLSAFVPVRIGLSGYSCLVTEGRGNATRTVELDDALHAHCVAVTSVLDRVYEKSVKTVFRGHDARITEFQKKLEDLRFVRDGNILIRAGGSSDPVEIRGVMVDAKRPVSKPPSMTVSKSASSSPRKPRDA